ncbi:hypothetical protein CRG98_011627 [Punica granatum]|uniref:Uncharacterized protein n=1 Tax=Punica granatum TaxID=22663 RepID=A0A2I0KHU6_PUNGR|nr:hypothetical protein CRG98_011627 [Punica granatum]
MSALSGQPILLDSRWGLPVNSLPYVLDQAAEVPAEGSTLPLPAPLERGTPGLHSGPWHVHPAVDVVTTLPEDHMAIVLAALIAHYNFYFCYFAFVSCSSWPLCSIRKLKYPTDNANDVVVKQVVPKVCRPEFRLVGAHMHALSHGLGVSTFLWGRMTDMREKESPLPVYDSKVEGR